MKREMKQEIYSAYKVMAVMMLTAVVLLLPMDVFASGGPEPFQSATTVVTDAWSQGRRIVYIIGGLGALALGVLAFFGRFKWTTLFCSSWRYFVIAIFGEIVTYLQGLGGTNITATTGGVN